MSFAPTIYALIVNQVNTRWAPNLVLFMTSLMLVICVHHRAFKGLGPVEYAIGTSAIIAVLIMVTAALKK